MDISKVISVPIADISLQGNNVRSDLNSEFSKEGIHELAENIHVNGLLQPIVLKGTFGNPPYDVIVGQRRFLAHVELGLEEIPATFTGEIDEMHSLLLSLSENMCRQEMNYIDTQNAITKLYNHFGKDEKKVQEHTGFSLRMIRNYVKIEEQASNKIKEFLGAGKISMADAKRAIDAAQGDEAKADQIIEELGKLTKYEKTRLVESGMKNPDAPVEKLLEDARKPRLEESLILNIPPDVQEAMQKASEQLSLGFEELTMQALVSWLQTNEYLAA